jgi:hypothetical protein
MTTANDADAAGALHRRQGLRVLDWNADRHRQGIPGHEIASIFSVVVGDQDDPRAPRFVHVRMDPDGPPRLWHSHPGWTTTVVLAGSMKVEGINFTEGQMVVVAPNVPYGPLEPGPEGATFLEIFHGEGATPTIWDESDRRVAEYREKGWIPPR